MTVTHSDQRVDHDAHEVLAYAHAQGVGRPRGHLLNPKVTQKVAAALFALVGVALIAGIF